MKVFSVSGYWNDDRTEIGRALVAEFDETPEGYEDDDIFFYGLSEPKLIGDHVEFTITSYEIVQQGTSEQLNTEQPQ